MTRRALLVVAKQPAPGQTKTRLSPPLIGDQAAALYQCFLLDTLDIIREAQRSCLFDPIIAYLPEGGEPYFNALAPDFGLLLQRGIDLSERLHHATSHCLMEAGYDQVVIMDSDSPTLPPASLSESFAGLDEADITFGRVDDGGKRCPLGAGDEIISRSERLEAWRIDDRVVVGKPALAGRILSKTKRQDAEPARRQPREPRVAADPAFLQS